MTSLSLFHRLWIWAKHIGKQGEVQAYSAQGLIECEGPPHLFVFVCPLALFSLLWRTNTIRGSTNTPVPPRIRRRCTAVIYTSFPITLPCHLPVKWSFAESECPGRFSLWCLSRPVKLQKAWYPWPPAVNEKEWPRLPWRQSPGSFEGHWSFSVVEKVLCVRTTWKARWCRFVI